MKTTLSKFTLAMSILLAAIFTFSCATSKAPATKQQQTYTACSDNTENIRSCTESYNSETHYCSNGTVKEYGSVSHNGQTYKYVEIGDQSWMAENLNYYVPLKSLCYNDNQENCKKYGRLYNLAAAQKICPNGWHLPSEADWEKLVEFAGGTVAGCKLKEKNNWDKNSTDEYGFSAIPGGRVAASNTGSKVAGFGLATGLAFAGVKAGSKSVTNAAVKDMEKGTTMFKANFEDVGSYGYWWSSTKEADKNFYYSMDNKNGNVTKNVSTDDTEKYSVRCVSDKTVSTTPVETSEENETSQTNNDSNVE